MGCNSQPDSQSEDPESAEGWLWNLECAVHTDFICVNWGEHGLSRQISLPLTGSSKGDQVTEPTHQHALRTDTAKYYCKSCFPVFSSCT
jgi:hypothetical protein